MIFKTQFTAQKQAKIIGEVTGEETPVIKTNIRGNSEKLAQMQLAGVYAEGQRLGYHFEADEKLPAVINPPPGRGVDVIDVLKYAEDLNAKIRKAVINAQKGVTDETVTGGVRKEVASVGKDEGSTPGKGVSTPASA